jgi:hypothetical protein
MGPRVYSWDSIIMSNRQSLKFSPGFKHNTDGTVNAIQDPGIARFINTSGRRPAAGYLAGAQGKTSSKRRAVPAVIHKTLKFSDVG